MNVRTAVLIILLGSYVLSIHAQLTVDAGRDAKICMSCDTIKLGGNPTAQGGKEPYTYQWELMPVNNQDHLITTSEILSDSTSANPFIGCSPVINDTAIFMLTVTDAELNSSTDSVKIIISSIQLQTLVGVRPVINQGDSVQLNPINIVNGIAPFSYTWSPESGLSNPNTKHPYAKPDSSTLYTCLVTDAIGCTAYDENKVMVIPTGISDVNITKYFSVVFPNPITMESRIEVANPSNEKLRIKVVNTVGQVIVDDWFSTEFYSIGRHIKIPGNYIYTISIDKKIVSSGTLLKS